MQSNRTPFALFVIFLLVLTYTEIFIRPATEREQAQAAARAAAEQTAASTPQASPAVPQQNPSSDSSYNSDSNQIQEPNAPKLLTASDYARSKVTHIESKLLRISIRHLGGRLTSYRLNRFKRELHDKHKLDLVTLTDRSAPLGLRVGSINDEGVEYSLESFSPNVTKRGSRFEIPKNEQASFVFAGSLSDGTRILKTIEVSDHNYIIGLSVKAAGPSAETGKIALLWNERLNTEDASQYNVKQITTFNQQQRELDRHPIGDITAAPTSGNNNWIGYGDNYFANIMISTDPSAESSFLSEQEMLKLSLAVTGPQANFKLFAGPKDRDLLMAAGYGLERSMDLGWFAVVGQPLLGALKALNSFLGNYGLAIILLTLILKLLLLPLTQSSFKSMKGLQAIQPQVTALRERLKDNPNQMHLELMELYKKNGVNPLGGCIPALLQIPIFLGMYNALQNSIYLRHAPFALWVQDLAAPEKLMILGIPVPFMILLMGGSMFLQMVTTPSTGDPMQRKIMLFMPVAFTISFIFLPIPSGLVLYWLVSNLISIVQQLALHRFKRVTPLQATLLGSVTIMLFSFVLTLL